MVKAVTNEVDRECRAPRETLASRALSNPIARLK